MTSDPLTDLLAEHRAAVHHFIQRAAAIPDDRWRLPRAEGKWTPAQETRHIILTYQAMIGDLRDGRKMVARNTGLRRVIWRMIGLGSILYRRRIPAAVRAPREVRPEAEEGTRLALLDELRGTVDEFERVFSVSWRDRPRQTLSHPFFGEVSLRQSMTIAVVHTRHHAAFLPAAGAV